MSGKQLKDKVKELSFSPGSKYKIIQLLVIGDFFDYPKTTGELIEEVRSSFGKRIKSNEVQSYMKKFMEAGIIRAIRVDGVNGNFWVLTSTNRDLAINLAPRGKKKKIGDNVLPDKLIMRMGKDFAVEIRDLNHNFRESGTCTAFLLRKILEKLIYFVFTKNNLEKKIEDKPKPGGLVGLETMINLSSLEKVRGIPFLTPKTAVSIKGMKFLGDVAAHSPLVNVDIKVINSQMPYIITAFEELSKRL
jgi:hypothetical protein